MMMTIMMHDDGDALWSHREQTQIYWICCLLAKPACLYKLKKEIDSDQNTLKDITMSWIKGEIQYNNRLW